MKNTAKKHQPTGKLKLRINKGNFVSLLSLKSGLSLNKTEEILDLAIETIMESLAENKSVMIKDFGTFEVRKVKPKKQNGKFSKKAKTIPSHKRPKFKAAKNWIKALN